MLNAIGNKAVSEAALLEFTISAADQDNDTLSYSADSLPQGATFANQKFSWRPDYTQAGNYSITFTASDGKLTDSEGIIITVANLDIAPQNATADAVEGGKIELNWQHSSNGEKAKYNIYYDKGTGSVDYTTPIADVDYPTKTWTSSALTDGVTYIFGIRAVDPSGLEEKNTNVTGSATADSTPPGKPGKPALIE